MKKMLWLLSLCVTGSENMLSFQDPLSKYLQIFPASSVERTGLYIVVEGIEGCGKSTAIKLVTKALQEAQLPVIATKEPGGTNLGLEIRKILEHRTAPTCPNAEFLLFAADRAQHFEELVQPHLENNEIVISDRSCFSALAYQGYLKGVSTSMMSIVNTWAMKTILPDIIFYIKIDPALAAQRVASRNTSTKFEEELLPRLHILAEAFDTMFELNEHVITIDATKTPQEIADSMTKAIMSRFLNQPTHYAATKQHDQYPL